LQELQVSLGWYTQSDSLPKLKPVVDVFLDHEDEYKIRHVK
jgi:hypothetical protein